MTNKKILTLISFLLLVSFLLVGCMLPKQNLPPEITSTPVTTATVGVDYTYNVVATDPNAGDVLTYSLIDEPDGMLIDEDSGKITWTPDETGDFPVTVKVSDEEGLSDTQSFTLKVSEFVVELIKIEVDPETVTVCIPLLKGLTETFTVTATYNDTTTKVVTSDCVYGVDDTSIAIVSAGNVTALKVGSATVSISYTEEGITKGTTLNIIVKGTITIRWLEAAVRYNPDGSVHSSWLNDLNGPATLILTDGGYHFADVAEYYNVAPANREDYNFEGNVFIDETGQLSGHTTYTLYELDTINDFEGQVEIIIYDEAVEDIDGTMVGTYTQWKYAYAESDDDLAILREKYFGKAVLAPEIGSGWWFVQYTEYFAHGEDELVPTT